MKNITQSGYETITVIRSQYDPVIGQCLTISPVLWIKESKDKDIEDQKYFVFARNGCIRDIFDIKDPIALEILTECGYVQADENGQIKIEGSCGIRAVADDCPDFCINLLTGYGLKGGGQICKGETRTIELDADITGDVRGPDSAQVGDVPVFKDETGKSITTSNINSVDGLTKITKTTQGEQKLLVETIDTESGSNAGVEAKSTGSGYPYFKLTHDEHKWRERINPENGYLEKKFIDSSGNENNYFLINKDGNTVTPKQYSVSAKYEGRSPNFPDNSSVPLGKERTLTILEQTGNNFFPGNSESPAYYEFKEPHTVSVSMTFVIRKDGNTTLGFLEGTAQIERRGSINQFYYSLSQIPDSITNGSTTLYLSKIIKGQTGDKIYFYLSGRGKDWYIYQPLDPKISSYIDIMCIG